MLYYNQSPYYQWFLSSQKKTRAKVEGNVQPAQGTGKNYTGPTI